MKKNPIFKLGDKVIAQHEDWVESSHPIRVVTISGSYDRHFLDSGWNFYEFPELVFCFQNRNGEFVLPFNQIVAILFGAEDYT